MYKNENINWQAIEKQFINLCEMLFPFEIPTEEDIEHTKLHILTYGQIPSTYFTKLQYGEAIYINADEKYKKQQLEALKDVAVELGFIEDTRTHIPDYLKQSIPDYRHIINCGIAQKQISTEFLYAWARLNFLAGQYVHLIMHNEAAEDKFDQMLEGIRQSTLINEHWYAHWVHANAPSLKEADRDDCQNALAILCHQITKGEVKPAKPYPKEWFARMCVAGKENIIEPEELKSTYTKLSQKKIRAMLEHTIGLF